MNNLESAFVLSTALTQFIENADDVDVPTERDVHHLKLAQEMLDQVDAILAGLAK